MPCKNTHEKHITPPDRLLLRVYTPLRACHIYGCRFQKYGISVPVRRTTSIQCERVIVIVNQASCGDSLCTPAGQATG